MARTYFENLPSTNTPLEASRLNGFLNGDESIEKLVVGDVECKNLFTGLIKGVSIDNSTGASTVSTTASCSDFIPVTIDSTHSMIISGLSNTISVVIGAYNSNKEFLGRTARYKTTSLALNDSSFTSGTPQGTGNIAYIKVKHYVYSSDTGTIDDIDGLTIQLEYGSSITPYTPHKKFGYNSIESMGKIVVDDIRSKNILQNNLSTTTIGNLTITVNADKSITLNGTAPSGTKAFTIDTIAFKKNKYYTISGIKGYSASTLQMQVSSSSAFPSGSRLATYNGPTTRIAKDDEVCDVKLYTYNETSYNNVTIYPQIEEKNSATDYVEYKQFDCTAYKLWDNPDPTSEFAAQTITLNDDIKNYKYYEMLYAYSTSNSTRVFSTGKIPVTNSSGMLLQTQYSYRRYINVSTSSFAIADCVYYATYGSSTTATLNTYLIPYMLLAYK